MKSLIPSFRLRMFLVTALTVAVVLVGVAVIGGLTFYAYEVQRLDARLCAEAWRLASRPPETGQLDRFAADVAGKLNLKSTSQLLLQYTSRDDREELRSPGWPRDMALNELRWPAPPPPDTRRPSRRDACSVTGFDAGGKGWRAARASTPESSGFVAANLAAIRSELWGALTRIASIAGPLALGLTGIGAWLLSGLALRPVNRLRDAMKAVDERALDQRLASEREDPEFQALISSYNSMLQRLESSFNMASRFSADAAHELKTPLTILRGQIERAIALSENRAIQVNLVEMLDEVGRLASISRKLLLLSQADAGRLALLPTRVDLSRMLHEAIADARMLGLEVTISEQVDAGLSVEADEQLLAQVLNNLSSNAIKYTPAGGRISVRARALPSGIEVTYSNSVRGVSQQDRQRFFERFYRGNLARNRAIDGHGLGLSLSRVIARAHGGDLTLEPSADDLVVMRLTLPARAGVAP